MSRQILCYGDSNTYGYNPATEGRYGSNIRWTNRLQDMLGEDFTVINAGLNARTTDINDPFQPGKNGLEYLEPILLEYRPVDLMILMLGSNDMKFYFHRTAEMIAKAAGRLVDRAQDIFYTYRDKTEVLLVSPPLIGKNIATSPFHLEFKRKRGYLLSQELAPYYREQAASRQIHFMDAAPVTEVSSIDSLHLSPEGHRMLAEALYKEVLSIFNMRNS